MDVEEVPAIARRYCNYFIEQGKSYYFVYKSGKTYSIFPMPNWSFFFRGTVKMKDSISHSEHQHSVVLYISVNVSGNLVASFFSVVYTEDASGIYLQNADNLKKVHLR
jgi:hypothetical protein